ncbi:MAG: PHP domain-containing protein [Chloroflexi bacterium]|nr:PHP domain-containing protein [Chloroflexota bacterium]
MRIDLHIHTRTGSDGNFSIEEVFREARQRKIDFISITDHDSLESQEKASALAREYGIAYITGVELNVAFPYNIAPDKASIQSKSISLDFLGYGYDVQNQALNRKLKLMKEYREMRALQILEKLNIEFDKENIKRLTGEDIRNIEADVDGVFGRPHIARYLVKKGIVHSNQEAFDKYLVKCDVPKYPLSLAEASEIVRNAGGRLILAHPNDPNGTSLLSLTKNLDEQANIIRGYMMEYIDGVECWHSRSNSETTAHYLQFARGCGLLMTGGSDCHQKPLLMGTLDIPDWVAAQFRD